MDPIIQAFDEAVCSTIGHLCGSRPTAIGAPAILTEGMSGEVLISGGWRGKISAHCNHDATNFLIREMSTMLIDRPNDQAQAAVELLLESVANGFMRHFSIKSEILLPEARPWSMASNQASPVRVKVDVLHRIACDLPVGIFTFGLQVG
jgi:CheY-specific phosphatase CheX